MYVESRWSVSNNLDYKHSYSELIKLPNNNSYTIKGGYLIAKVKIEPVTSKSGKSIVVASTRGRETFVHDGKEVHVNLNAYHSKEE